jgi:hypothetical protein
MSLTGSAGGVFSMTGDATDSRRFLGPCAPVLAVAQSGSAAPLWLTVNSSWPQGALYCVVFRESGSVYGSLIQGGTLQVIGFENIQSITQQTFTIE